MSLDRDGRLLQEGHSRTSYAPDDGVPMVASSRHVFFNDIGDVAFRPYPETSVGLLPTDAGRFGNRRLRFTVVFTALSWLLALSPLLLSFIVPSYSSVVNGCLAGVIGLFNVFIIVSAARNLGRVGLIPVPAWEDEMRTRRRQFKHIVVVPCCWEDIETLSMCLVTLAIQQDAGQSLVVVMSFEKRSPDLAEKITFVSREYKSKFADFIVVVHDENTPQEAQGGAANRNFALREAYKYCSARHSSGLRLAKYTVTTCEGVSQFHPAYFKALEACYNVANPNDRVPVARCIWQPPILFNWGLVECWWFTRVLYLTRSFLVLGASTSIMGTMVKDVYSYPLELALESKFINPRYLEDDSMLIVRALCASRSKVSIKLLPVPVLCAPQCAGGLLPELQGWWESISRLNTGNSEAFHYFCIHCGSPFVSGVGWVIRHVLLSGLGLSAGGVLTVLAAIPYPWTTRYTIVSVVGIDWPFETISMLTLAMLMIGYIGVFICDAVIPQGMLSLSEDVNPVRNLLHWLGAPLVFLGISAGSLVHGVLFAICGRPTGPSEDLE